VGGSIYSDRQHGRGTYTSKDGVVTEGEWRDGELVADEQSAVPAPAPATAPATPATATATATATASAPALQAQDAMEVDEQVCTCLV
jgi:hypothetical protein